MKSYKVIFIVLIVAGGIFRTWQLSQRVSNSVTSPTVANEAVTTNTPSNLLIEGEAVMLVRKLPEVISFLKDVPNGVVEVDSESEDKTAWTVHVYEVKDDHTATFNWFDVNKQTKEIGKMF